MAAAFEPFGLVRWQTRHESTVDYNLADSSCTPVALDEFIDGDTLARLAREGQHYAPVGGTGALRELIAAWHGAGAGQVMVTVGAAEANTLLVETLVQAGDHVVVMEPGYRQIWGAARNAGAKVETIPLDPGRGWAVDLEALDRVVRTDTRVISITNPNNPTGSILSDVECAAIVAAARRGRALLTAWAAGLAGVVSMVPPRATALGLVRYRKEGKSLPMAAAIRQAGVLVGAGIHFGAEGHLRIAHALDAAYVTAALERIDRVLR